jgi:hypothetical protein
MHVSVLWCLYKKRFLEHWICFNLTLFRPLRTKAEERKFVFGDVVEDADVDDTKGEISTETDRQMSRWLLYVLTCLGL